LFGGSSSRERQEPHRRAFDATQLPDTSGMSAQHLLSIAGK
jgi:hypothetical protein